MSAVDEAYDALLTMLRRGEIPAGTPLHVADLSPHLGFSAVPIREALRRLQGRGLVEFSSHRGAAATALDRRRLLELADLRAVLEPELLRRAFGHLQRGAINQAEQLLASLEAVSDGSEDPTVLQLHRGFHRALTGPAASGELAAEIERLRDLVDLAAAAEQPPSLDVASHRALLTAVRHGDLHEAAEALEGHLVDGHERIIELI